MIWLVLIAIRVLTVWYTLISLAGLQTLSTMLSRNTHSTHMGIYRCHGERYRASLC